MKALVMAGGVGSRMHIPYEKPTILRCIMRIIHALRRCPDIQDIVVATSCHTPHTHNMIREYACALSTPGHGYSADLASALDATEGPVLILPGDMPLLDSHIISHITALYSETHWDTVLIPDSMGSIYHTGMTVTSGNTLCRYTGISMVDSGSYHRMTPAYHIIRDRRLAANINTIQDVISLFDASYNLSEYNCL